MYVNSLACVRVKGDDSEGFRVRDCVILDLRKCIWNALLVLLGVATFEDIGSLGYLPRLVTYHPSSSTLVIASRFLTGNREAELKPTTFSSFLLLSVFVSLFFSCLPLPQRFSALSTAC